MSVMDTVANGWIDPVVDKGADTGSLATVPVIDGGVTVSMTGKLSVADSVGTDVLVTFIDAAISELWPLAGDGGVYLKALQEGRRI